MRKDVKIAFVVGGILIAVLVVYVMVVPAGQKNPANKAVSFDTGPQQKTEPTTPAPSESTSTVANSAETAKTEPAPAAKPDAAPTTKPSDPFASNDSSNGDKWMLALNRGTVPMMTSSAPKITPEPIAIKPQITQVRTTSTPQLESSTPTTQPSTPEAAPVSATAGRTHLVQKGETIAQIAQAAYGSQNYWPYIIRANPGIVAEKIRPGMTLNLPDESEVKGTATSSVATATPAGAEIKPDTAGPIDTKSQYEVQSGDSLAKISMKLYGNSSKWETIYDLNKEQIGSDPAKVKVKTILKLPEPPTAK
ncbi:MAG TPA: LysM peptidoglycan-binding domain-containing protein [Tepidisphaeraceae bacterium]|jgi:nucleoid-associated protein YgaU|nr:LysM peptidoglycan-binding domain-containing protein [Tepidisphaeraceae bacterium]